MSRGFVSGVFWGGIISTLFVSVISLNSPLPGDAPPKAGDPEVPAGSGFNHSREDQPATLPEQSAVNKPPEADGPAQPAPDGIAAIGAETKAPGARPETGAPESALDQAPAADGASPEVQATTSAPPAQAKTDPAPTPPMAEAGPEAQTRPASPPPAAGQSAGATDGAVGFPTQDLKAASESPLNQSGEAQPQDAAPAVDPAPVETARADVAPQVPAPDDATPAEPTPTPAPAPTPAETDEAADDATPGRPATVLTDRASEHRSKRLPSIGGEGAEADTGATETAEAPVDPDAPPLQRWAVPFVAEAGKPLMTIILIDDGSSPLDPVVLSEFPYPLTIALDPAWEGAGAAMQAYRAAGFEVMLLASIAPEATAQDLEIAFEAWTAAVPEVTAVMEKPGLGLQASRDASQHLGKVLAGSGHGLILYPNGFDTARKLAEKEGVPSATIFRDFDAEGQDPAVIRRFLDHAAFKAGQGENVVMVGRLRQETVQALLVWGLQDRAGRISIAPVSGLLMATAADDAG